MWLSHHGNEEVEDAHPSQFGFHQRNQVLTKREQNEIMFYQHYFYQHIRFLFFIKKNFFTKKKKNSTTWPPAAPMLPVPSTMPATVARASWLPLSTSCRPRSAEMAELIMEDGPPMQKPVAASKTPFMAWSLGEPGDVGGRHSYSEYQ